MSSTANPKTYLISTNKDSAGSDIKSMGKQSVESCKTTCSTTDNCIGFVFDRRNGVNNCWFKNKFSDTGSWSDLSGVDVYYDTSLNLKAPTKSKYDVQPTTTPVTTTPVTTTPVTTTPVTTTPVTTTQPKTTSEQVSAVAESAKNAVMGLTKKEGFQLSPEEYNSFDESAFQLFIGSVSVLGLFVLYRIIQKSK